VLTTLAARGEDYLKIYVDAGDCSPLSGAPRGPQTSKIEGPTLYGAGDFDALGALLYLLSKGAAHR